ncbi:hypothetical protein F5X96DRAFT_595148 [Biscogniauxia mediterranea]|nr:hypothetical protein F5X96DRAFT_595148 [Biscogniauxia mediterranea]
MADVPPPPPSSTKRALPFKRTFKRRAPAESPGSNDDSLSLFSRAKEFFPSVLEDQQRRAREKAAKAKREEEESALRDQISREEESAKKRRRVSLPDDGEKMQERSGDEKEEEHNDDDDDDDDDVFSDNPRKSRKSSRILPHTPTSRRERSVLSSSKGGSRAPPSHSRKSETPVIALDDDSDEGDRDERSYAMSTSSAVQSYKKSGKTSAALLRDGASDSDSDLEMVGENTGGKDRKENKGGEDEDEDDGAMYIKMAMERIERARQERMAREGGGGTTVSDGALVELLVGSYLDFIRPISFKVRTRQPLKIMFDTWVEQQVKRRGVEARPLLQDMFFTWKGNRVYPHTTLETLGICPDADGRLYPAWRDKQDGFQNQKVYFEAWTKDLYDQYQREKEQKRKQELGEWDDDDAAFRGSGSGSGGDNAAEPGAAAAAAAADEQPAEEKRVRVTFKAKDLPSKNATLRSNTTVAMMIKVFRKLAQVPPEQHIQLRFDGEVLDDDMTVEEADIGDLDSVEVHIR